MKRWIIGLLVAAALGVAGNFGYRHYAAGKTAEPRYRTGKVERGDVIQVVRATGTIQPIRMVQVGTQVNGPINKLYVDYNSQVKAGDLVAQIDPTTYEARLAQDQANLAQSQATVEQTQAKLTQAEKELERARKLTARDMISQADLDTATATRDVLTAQLKVSQAAVAQAEASLRLSRANLGYTTIRSPVDGVVINRKVSEGQTVVASMTAQTLFLIATDLRKIQVEASIPEADIGNIALGQQVTFTVDAFDMAFTGSVTQIRMAAETVQNVVTYPVVIQAGNPDTKLFPSMTADIVCEVARHENVLKIPNAALRFKPEETPDKSGGTAAMERAASRKTAPKTERGPKVWIEKPDGSGVKPVFVSLGITDGAFTELKQAGTLTEEQAVITGLLTPADADKTVNPFTPQMPGNARRATR
ncbi:MAG: efflux RND transporter periplasmic adaptor subunit [bacterium]